MTFRVICSPCLDAGRLTLLAYQLRADMFTCPEHGPQMTGEFMWRYSHRTLTL